MRFRVALVAPLALVGVLLAAAAVPDPSSRPSRRDTAPADSAAAVAVVDSLHQRMAAGDSAGVLALLTPDALVLEGGGIETLDEYRSHHLPGDIAFVRAVPSSRSVRQIRVVGDAAWVTSTSESKGAYKGRQLDRLGAELMALRRVDGNWQIAAVHWSSRPRAGGH
ncbi:MAG: nuclear transport factor 2 family protein [Gemmatimonadales bacterium]